MIRYFEEQFQPEHCRNGNTALAVEVTRAGTVRTVRLSTNTGRVLKVLRLHEGEDARRQAAWVFSGKYGKA